MLNEFYLSYDGYKGAHKPFNCSMVIRKMKWETCSCVRFNYCLVKRTIEVIKRSTIVFYKKEKKKKMREQEEEEEQIHKK